METAVHGPAAATRPLNEFWELPAGRRHEVLLAGVAAAHAYHYERNAAYRRALELRGVGPNVDFEGRSVTDSTSGAAGDGAFPLPCQLPLLLRPAATVFKSYIDVLGTPFPDERPRAFLDWLAEHLSVPLPRERCARFRPRYRSLEALLSAIESQFADLGLEILTSSGTSGRASVIVRDRQTTDLNVESFYLCFRRYFGMTADHRALFLMPRRTRIAMACMARFSVARVGLDGDRIQFAIPFPAYPDQVRVRAGRTYRGGRRGLLERRLWHPAMSALQQRVVDPRTTTRAVAVLRRAAANGEKVLLFGSLIQLHRIVLELRRSGAGSGARSGARAGAGAGAVLRLAPGSLFGTGGGMKELYPATADEIRADVAAAAVLADGAPVPLRDVYGMAEANWAAMQCDAGNYHVPPWVLAVTLDDDDRPIAGHQTCGMLGFFDPFGGGDLYPGFLKTADRVTLCTGGGETGCPCGEPGAYLVRASIQRIDRLDEAGCAAQM